MHDDERDENEDREPEFDKRAKKGAIVDPEDAHELDGDAEVEAVDPEADPESGDVDIDDIAEADDYDPDEDYDSKDLL